MKLRRAAALLPSNVARFEQLMYLSVGLGLVELASGWNRFTADLSNRGGVRTAVFIVLYLFAFFVLLIWQAARGHKNWARWVLLIIFAVTIPSLFPRLDDASVTLLARILRFGQFLTEGVALFLIFTGNARAWYGTQSNNSTLALGPSRKP
jgi:hypothetical protein